MLTDFQSVLPDQFDPEWISKGLNGWMLMAIALATHPSHSCGVQDGEVAFSTDNAQY